ncbi:MAG: tetratricopeptide repeat protein [Wolinella sp.]
MPRWLLSALLLFAPLNALDVVINSAKEGGKNFAVLNLKYERLFPCKEERDRYGEVERVVCRIEGQPPSSFTHSNTLFFKLSVEQINSTPHLIITPKKRAKLFALHADPKEHTPLLSEEAQLSMRWQVIGYEDQIPFLSNKPHRGINFPIKMESTRTPLIGALDVFKKPLEVEAGGDVPLYLSIRGLMDQGLYSEAISAIDDAFMRYPETIFKRELLLFKIRAFEALNDPDSREELVALAKSWSRAYPADSSIPEVLYILAKTYGDLRFFDEARYYYDRLFTEYRGNNFELLARIALGDELLRHGDNKRTPQLYADALNESKNLDTASFAALRLAEYHISKKNFPEAEKLLSKVLQAHAKFFQKDPLKTYKMIEQWALEEGFYLLSAQIAESMWNSGIKEEGEDGEDLPEKLLRQAGIWYEFAGNFDDAHRIYRLYREKYEDRAAFSKIVERDDKLLFVLDESDARKRLARLDEVIVAYPNSPEKEKAYERKAETYVELGEWENVLLIERFLKPENPSLITATTRLVQKGLKENDCKKVAFYMQNYRHLELSNLERIFSFDCLLQGALLPRAEELASEGIQRENLGERLEWLYRYAQVLEALPDYPRAINAARDALMLADSLKKVQFAQVAFILFNALAKEQREDEAREVFARLQREYTEDSRMIEAYRMMLLWASKKLDEVAIELYAKELLRLQKLHARPEFSPWAELVYIDSLLRLQRFNDALKIVDELLAQKLDSQTKIKVLYIRGSTAQRVGNLPLARESYERCSKSDEVSAWKNLCTEALKLLN